MGQYLLQQAVANLCELRLYVCQTEIATRGLERDEQRCRSGFHCFHPEKQCFFIKWFGLLFLHFLKAVVALKLKKPDYAAVHTYLVVSKEVTQKDMRGISRQLLGLRLADKDHQYPLALNIIERYARLHLRGHAHQHWN